jgi:hypothetical protein
VEYIRELFRRKKAPEEAVKLPELQALDIPHIEIENSYTKIFKYKSERRDYYLNQVPLEDPISLTYTKHDLKINFTPLDIYHWEVCGVLGEATASYLYIDTDKREKINKHTRSRWGVDEILPANNVYNFLLNVWRYTLINEMKTNQRTVKIPNFHLGSTDTQIRILPTLITHSVRPDRASLMEIVNHK